MKKLEEIDENLMGTNPFVRYLQIPVTENAIRGRFKFENDLNVPDTFLAERTPYVRLFIPAMMKSRIFNLSGKATKLFIYIIYNMESGKDYVRFNPENYKSKMGFTADNTILTAKKELMRYHIIMPSIYKSVWWVDPEVMFPGNRITKYPGNLNQVYPKLAE